ncbi:hypothetical protein GCM10020256_50940 [Streptomyces thermocoprophilus]
MGEQRPVDAVPSAAQGRVERELLVGGDMRHEAREERVRRGHGQRVRAGAADRRLDLDDRVVGEERQRAPVEGVDDLVGGAGAAQQRGGQVDGGLRVVGAAAPGEQRRFLVERGIAVHAQQFGFHRRHLGGPGRLGALLADHVVVRVVVAQVVGGDHAEPVEEGARQAQVGGDALAVLGEQFRQDVLALGAAEADAGLPGEVVETDVVEVDVGGVDVEEPGELALEADGHVAQADRAVALLEQGAGDDADGVGEVDDPGAGVAAADPVGDVQDDGHGAQRFGEAACAGGLLADAAAVQGARSRPVRGRPARRRAAGSGPRRRRPRPRPGRRWW